MKLYSDVLTGDEIESAVENVDETLYVDFIEPLDRTRVRSRGWDVKFGRIRPANASRPLPIGGSITDEDYGRLLALLFALDPTARIDGHDGAEAFHEATGYAYTRSAGLEAPHAPSHGFQALHVPTSHDGLHEIAAGVGVARECPSCGAPLLTLEPCLRCSAVV